MSVFSHSRAETFKMCPFKYKLSYIDNLDTIQSDDADNALIVGSALHYGIENGVQAGINSYKSQYNILSDEHINEIIKLEYLIPKVDNFINLDNCQFEYEINTNDFKGFIDYLDASDPQNVKIYDFKYSNNVDRYMLSDQLHLYKYFYEKLNPLHNVSELGFIFIPKTSIKQRKNENINEFRKRILNELARKEIKLIKVNFDYKKVVNWYSTVKNALECTDFKKNETNFCRFCNFYNYCQKGVTYDLIEKKQK